MVSICEIAGILQGDRDTCKKIKSTPKPKKAPDMTWGTQVMCGLDVQPNQNMPTGNMIPPMIIGSNRSSG